MKKGFIVYGIAFENGELYIGSTRDLKKRMYEHTYRSKTKDLPLYRAMREQNFYEFVIIDGIETREKAYDIEKKITRIYHTVGCSLLNKNNIDRVVSKVDGRRTEEYRMNRMGAKNPNSKPKEYFETTSTQRSCFKNVCKNQGWDLESFIEVLDVEKSGRIKKYYYISK